MIDSSGTEKETRDDDLNRESEKKTTSESNTAQPKMTTRKVAANLLSKQAVAVNEVESN